MRKVFLRRQWGVCLLCFETDTLPNPIRWTSWQNPANAGQTSISSGTYSPYCKCDEALKGSSANLAQVLAEGYKPITTQIFDKESKYLEDDSVFAVKDSLVVEFVPREGDQQAKTELKYDILMAPMNSKGEPGDGLVTTGMSRGY
jgi:hypothetical protein